MLDSLKDAKSWERYFKDIVKLHYRPCNYKDVPDKHTGDFGIECYTLSGHVFQCYLPEQNSDLAKLLDAQKSKIRRDIKKFTVDNVNDFAKLFGDLKISRWILATPYNQSAELAQYCSEKSIKVRAVGLSYVSDDFEIIVHTADDYPQEAKQLQKTIYQLTLSFDEVSEQKKLSWIDENIAFLKNLDLKIPKIEKNSSLYEQRRSFIVQKYLEYQNLFDLLRTDWADLYETIYRCVSHRQSNLEGRFLISNEAQPSVIIKEEIEQLRRDIHNEIKTLKSSDLEIIIWGVIADWLIRCPLDF